ncbi:MAG TPA: type II secretion system minor pseudopilin GspI [Cellvibrio sp.]|nr:type II secretion system minor pseudopilin GspI [Cellvibrio sp.]
MKIANTSSRKFASGFTLIEVMVALVIVATALPALVMLVMSQAEGAAHIREKTYAMWLAENELSRITLLKNNIPGYKLPEKDSGSRQMMGLQWQWEIETKVDETFPILLRIDIAVKLLGVAEGNGYTGVKDAANIDPLAVLTGYTSAE